MRMSIPRRLTVITAGLGLAGAFSGLGGVVAIQTGVLVVIHRRNRSVDLASHNARANER